MTLHQLPTEIILQIISLLTAHDYTQLVLVCKSWYCLFIPHLYHHVMLPLNDYCDCTYGHMRSSRDLPVRRFTHAVIENPALALMIHSLELYPSDCKGKWRNRPPLEPLAEEKYRASMLPYGQAKRKHRRKFHAWRRDLKHRSERQDWYRYSYYHEDAWLALLLVQVKNLEKLAIELPEERNHTEPTDHQKNSVHFERVIQWASSSKLGILTHLTHVSLTNGPCFWEMGTAVDAVPLNRLIPFLRIPSLRKLYVRNPCDRSPLHLPKDLVLPITHLDIEWPRERLPNLPRLLERCSQLESFTLEQDELHNEHSDSLPDLSLLYPPLRKSLFSLRYLNLTFDSGRVWQDAVIPRPTFLGTLADFPNLDSVHMRWANLLPFLRNRAYDPSTPLWKLLPRSLTHLYIDDCLIQCSSTLCMELESLMKQFPGNVPLLQTLYLRFAAREQEPGQGCLECLKRWSTRREMQPDLVAESLLQNLQHDFGTLGIAFRIIEREKNVPFAQDHAIRKKWPRGDSGKIRVLN
ncbi:hypothetical protein BO78DRAFT_447986 [Aspergillus sclerotiicarbonarius CBS 121057]|uniref:F-box domain-containing protein n=1 Tax=Aspergillus sclerotiicarbonarius (strain CBS 121057 / IBT 28362) TaxID=1448318 RepID=A0A319FEQ2_ASPSB|nr:hypothetical protein BO78DRAFT_447986 [Aspergillus sclerotiicarbonarius CBS 121057]